MRPEDSQHFSNLHSQSQHVTVGLKASDPQKGIVHTISIYPHTLKVPHVLKPIFLINTLKEILKQKIVQVLSFLIIKPINIK